MLNGLILRISAAFSKLDQLAEKILRALSRLYNHLTSKLDLVLVKLDEVTRNLLKKYYRALEYLENLFAILRKLLRVLFPILLLFVPPAIGFVVTFFAYSTYPWDAVVVATMSTVLLLILIASFRSKAESAITEVTSAQAPLAIVAELESFGVGRKALGAAIALVFLAWSAYINVGLFIGLLLFILEVVVLYALKWFYGPTKKPEPRPEEAQKNQESQPSA